METPSRPDPACSARSSRGLQMALNLHEPLLLPNLSAAGEGPWLSRRAKHPWGPLQLLKEQAELRPSLPARPAILFAVCSSPAVSGAQPAQHNPF